LEADDGDVVLGVEGAFFSIDDLDEFVAHGLDVQVGEAAELFSEAEGFVGAFVDKGDFDAVAVEEKFVAGVQLGGGGFEFLFGEDAEEGAADVEFGHLSFFVDAHGCGVACAGDAKS